MTKEISKKLMCVQIRGGQELWMEDEQADRLKQILLSSKESKFIEYAGQVMNTADISGIFSAEVMEDKTRRRNGQWKGKDGKWHDKGERLCPGCSAVLPYGKGCGNCFRG